MGRYSPEVLKEETNITFKNFSQPDQWLPAPFGKKYLTNIYEFDIGNKEAFNDKKPLTIEIKYPDGNNNQCEVYFWNNPTQEWIKLPATEIAGQQAMRAIIHLPYARLVVMGYPKVMEYGWASWYKYKDCDCAASPDYPKGAFLEVTNLDNYKVLMVMVNDYGPERKKHPERAIDLDVTAFKKIASKRAGVIRVKVTPIL